MMLRNVGYEKEIDNHKEVETVVADKKRIQLPIPPAIQNNHSRGVSKKAAISASIVVVLVMTIFFLTVISGGGDFGASALPFFTLLGGLIWIVIFFIARIVLNIKTELGDRSKKLLQGYCRGMLIPKKNIVGSYLELFCWFLFQYGC